MPSGSVVNQKLFATCLSMLLYYSRVQNSVINRRLSTHPKFSILPNRQQQDSGAEKRWLLPLGHEHKAREMWWTWSRVHCGWTEQDRKGGRGREREESVCEQHTTRVNEGKHTWRRGCVERESLKEMLWRERKGGCAGGRKMLLPGNCSELRTSIFSSSGEDKNNTRRDTTADPEQEQPKRGKEKVGRCGCVTAIWHHHSGIRGWGGNISVGG